MGSKGTGMGPHEKETGRHEETRGRGDDPQHLIGAAGLWEEFAESWQLMERQGKQGSWETVVAWELPL